MEVTWLLLEQGPIYRAVLCPEDLDLADNIQILVFKIRSRAQCCLREGLEDKCFKGWKDVFNSQVLGTWSGGSGGARDEIGGERPEASPVRRHGWAESRGSRKPTSTTSSSICLPLYQCQEETESGWGCHSSRDSGERGNCMEKRKIYPQN